MHVLLGNGKYVTSLELGICSILVKNVLECTTADTCLECTTADTCLC